MHFFVHRLLGLHDTGKAQTAGRPPVLGAPHCDRGSMAADECAQNPLIRERASQQVRDWSRARISFCLETGVRWVLVHSEY
ncbi:uncharacterized [Tachysurus ichikawai]